MPRTSVPLCLGPPCWALEDRPAFSLPQRHYHRHHVARDRYFALSQWALGGECAKKLRPALGGELAARDPVWDGEGWGCDRVACLRYLVVSGRGRWRWQPPGGCRPARPIYSGRSATDA